MYTLINGSQRPRFSNSLYFLKKICEYIGEHHIFELRKDKYEKIIENIKKSEIILFSFPLYVDAPTSITLDFLDYVVDNKINLKNKLIYVIINCGFREGEQNITAINIIKNWCNKVGATFNSSIMIGAGEIVGKEKFKYISKNVMKKLKVFSNTVKNKKKKKDIITTVDFFSNKFFCYVANKGWKKDAANNNLSEDDIRVK